MKQHSSLAIFQHVCSFLAGIGRATCIALAKCGAEVIGFSRTQSDLDSLKNEVCMGFAWWIVVPLQVGGA